MLNKSHTEVMPSTKRLYLYRVIVIIALYFWSDFIETGSPL